MRSQLRNHVFVLHGKGVAFMWSMCVGVVYRAEREFIHQWTSSSLVVHGTIRKDPIPSTERTISTVECTAARRMPTDWTLPDVFEPKQP